MAKDHIVWVNRASDHLENERKLRTEIAALYESCNEQSKTIAALRANLEYVQQAYNLATQDRCDLQAALNASIAANELVLAQLRGGSDLSAEQVSRTLNAALDSANAVLSGPKQGGL